MTKTVGDTVKALSYSQITLHRKCAQAWYYRYDQHLTRHTAEPAVARDFGSWWHAVIAAHNIERGRALGSLKYVPERLSTSDEGPVFATEDITVEQVLVTSSRFWDKMNGDDKEAWTSYLGQELPTRLTNLYVAWRTEHADAIDNEEPLAVEMPWERALPKTSPDDPDQLLMGYLDEVYFDKRRKMVVVRDHKSHKALGASTSIDDMMDSQLQFYAWGAAPIIESWGLGKVRASAYDRARSVAPKTPQVTATGTLSKSVTDYDLVTYATWAAGPDGQGVEWGEDGAYYVSGKKKGEAKFGRYTAEDDVMEKLMTPAARSAWFQRTLVPLNRTLIQTHLGAAVDTAADIRRSQERVAVKHETARNLSANCKFCDYADFCRAQMFGGPDGEYDLPEFGLMKSTRKQRVVTA